MLQGVRVVDLTRMLAGPYATMLLGDLGAEVIKVEPPEGDEIRKMGPPFVGGESAYFLAINRNKKSVTLDLKTPAGRDTFQRLVAVSDVVVDNFRPGVLERLGAGYEALRRVNPKLISCSITSFGESGPLAQDPAFDLVIQAYAGAMSLTGEPGGPPVRMGIPMGDLAGGMYAALGVAAALYRREQTGQGERLSLSLLDSLASLLSYMAQYYFVDGLVPPPQGSRHMSVVPYGAFQAADRAFVVAVFTERFWASFCRAVERTDLIDDERFRANEARVRNRAVLEPMLETLFKARPADAWVERFRAEGVPVAPVNTVDRTFAMPQMANMVKCVAHPKAGTIRTLGSPLDLRMEPAPAPALGAHNEEILGRLLGLKPGQWRDASGG